MNRNRPFDDTICLLAGLSLSDTTQTRHRFQTVASEDFPGSLPSVRVFHQGRIGKLWLRLFVLGVMLLFVWWVSAQTPNIDFFVN